MQHAANAFMQNVIIESPKPAHQTHLNKFYSFADLDFDKDTKKMTSQHAGVCESNYG